MNTTAIKLSVALALLFVLGCQRQITLFDGKNLDNWERTGLCRQGMCESMKMAAWSLKWELN